MFKSTFARIGAVALVVTALAFTATSAPRPAEAQGNPITPNTVSVTGIGVSNGAPDAASVNLGVEVVSQDAAQAFNDANTLIEKVTQAIIDAGVAQDQITTTSVNIYSQPIQPMGPAEGTNATARTYTASILLRIQVLDEGTNGQATKVGQVINAAVEAGANVINGIEIYLNNTKTLEDDARVKAVADARARAEALAAAVGGTVGAVVAMEEYTSVSGPVYYAGRGGGGGGSAEASISQGQFTVSVQVRVTFALNAS
ncbi:MAG: SIMPL domain-containing protein [Anaerolineae bacterium]|nr:SIMPL domain-containing protein [Anaerolineae bacterium]